MNARQLFTLLSAAACLPGFAHEFPGHPGHDHRVDSTIGAEFYAGRRGYWHAGAAVGTVLGRGVAVEFGAHVVREESGAKEVPSFEAELIWEAGSGLELETFAFGYPETERRQAWGVGVRATRRFALQNGWSVAPFFGPAFAHVRAEDGETGGPATVRHSLLLGGATLEAGPCSLTLIGSHSFYNREVSGLATPVDFESMSHFAAYENNDGFPQDTLAVEFAWELSPWLTLHARYAALIAADETRHAIAFTPAVKIGERVEFTAGIQMLRGGEQENDLAFAGLSFSF